MRTELVKWTGERLFIHYIVKRASKNSNKHFKVTFQAVLF